MPSNSRHGHALDCCFHTGWWWIRWHRIMTMRLSLKARRHA